MITLVVMKRYLLLFMTLITLSAYSQGNLNNYKYVIVPERFAFQKNDDQYALNSSTKLLLEQKGFTVFLDNKDLPADVANNKCAALTADLQNNSGLFSTKLILLLKDCRGGTVFKSGVGSSREKDYDAAYNMALKDAFVSLEKVPYRYAGPGETIAQQPATVNVATTETVAVSDKSNAQAEIKTSLNTTLYAQPITNGYQLVDVTPKKVLTLLKTSKADQFIAYNNGGVSGVVYKANGEWVYEYYKNDKLISEKLAIKF